MLGHEANRRWRMDPMPRDAKAWHSWLCPRLPHVAASLSVSGTFATVAYMCCEKVPFLTGYAAPCAKPAKARQDFPLAFLLFAQN